MTIDGTRHLDGRAVGRGHEGHRHVDDEGPRGDDARDRGSLGFADADARLGYAYVMNNLDFYLNNDPREKALRDAVYRGSGVCALEVLSD